MFPGAFRTLRTGGAILKLNLVPVPASGELMDWLETKGIIRRILPGRAFKKTPPGTIAVETLYSTAPSFGSHKLIAVTVNQPTLSRLTAHPDREDFLLLGDPSATPMILTISLLSRTVLQEKITRRTLETSDLIAVLCRMNDPLMSFFTMNSEFPHAETCLAASGNPPSFYVSEPTGLPELHVYLEPYAITFNAEEHDT